MEQAGDGDRRGSTVPTPKMESSLDGARRRRCSAAKNSAYVRILIMSAELKDSLKLQGEVLKIHTLCSVQKYTVELM